MKFTTSLFSQILQAMPRSTFARLVHQCGAERDAKGFSSGASEEPQCHSGPEPE